jgi:hypothetical protein
VSAAGRGYCETCGETCGDCTCDISREDGIGKAMGRASPPAGDHDELREIRAHAVMVEGRWAHIVREEDGGYAVRFDDPRVPPFRARGLPSEVLDLAALHVWLTAGES